MMRAGAFTLVILAALACIFAGGRETWAKLAYAAGAYQAVVAMSTDDAVLGAALYRLRRYEEADAAFVAIGRTATYNRAATLAATGNHGLSVAYYDALLFADRDDDALYNRSVVAEFVKPVVGGSDGHGRIAAILAEAAGTQFEVNHNGDLVPSEVNVRKPVDAKSLAASQQWLDTLSDAPGEWLKKRLAAEYGRRKDEGLLHPPEPSPW